MLRNRADVKTLVWTLVLMPSAVVVQYVWPALAGWLAPLSIYLAYCAGVVAHNHNHAPTFFSRRANSLLAAWISFFYGYPVFAWIPTHNENHHKFTNAEGDATRTSQFSTRNTAWAAFAYFFHSARAQAPLIRAFLVRTRRKNRGLFFDYIGQYLVVALGHAGCLGLAIWLHGPGRGTFVYASALGIPSALALWGLMFTNYLQHVDCDASSEWNHSRNFVSPWMNWLIFDNGFHTVHHEKPGLHWSRARAEHGRIAELIDPRFCEGSIFSYCFKTYVLKRSPAPATPRFAARFATEPLAAYEMPAEPPSEVAPTGP